MPAKPNNTITNAYRPIVFFNIIEKALEFIIAKPILYLNKINSLLPQNHVRARKSSFTKLVSHYLIKSIYTFWNKRKIATAFFLDKTGEFDNIFQNWLLNNLHMKKFEPRIVNWISSFLTDKMIILKNNEYSSEKIHISTRISQESPLFPILFFFYNLMLWKKLNLETNTDSAGYVDIIAIFVEGNIIKENNVKADQWVMY